MAIRKPKVSAREARRMAGQIPAKDVPQDIEPTVVSQAPLQAEQAPSPSPLAPAPPAPEMLAVAETAPPPSPVHVSAPSPAPAPAPAPERVSGAPAIRNRKTQVFLSAVIPAPGVSKSFDELARFYPAPKALQMILRRAMSDYEILLANGKFAKTTMAYPVAEGRPDQLLVQTSRSMPNVLVDVALAHFDPLGFESKRAFGLKLATAALATFFKSEG